MALGLAVASGVAAAEPSVRPVAWTNQHLLGSPESPSPYVVERLFDSIELRQPLYVAPQPGSDRLWIVLQGGENDRPSRIVTVANRSAPEPPDVALTLPGRLIYSLVFHPGFDSNRWVYVFSNGPTVQGDRTNRVARYTVTTGDAARCEPDSELPILSWRSAGHDGGDMAFGRDGMLYIASGDGTSDSDGWDSGQDLTRLLAKLLRIDVDRPLPGRPYSIPQDNPFVGLAGARPETWAYGFRNPWRMGIDERTGEVWVGQNGQDLWESAHCVQRGDNLGWSLYEGTHPFHPNRRPGPTPFTPPLIEHHHSEFRSLTGGPVYYGERHPELNGVYIYGDYSTGRIWGARRKDGRLSWQAELADTTLQIAAFRVDPRGHLLIVDHGGGIYRLVKRPPQSPGPPFPRRLSETGLFVATAELRPHPGLIAYAVNAPAWADGAEASRYVAFHAHARAGYTATRGWNFTNGTVLVQTLSLPSHVPPGQPAARRRIETRLLVRADNEWNGYSYRWNEAQTDAELIGREGLTVELPSAGGAGSTRRWRFPSRSECLTCHSRAVNFVLGFSTAQLNRPAPGPDPPENQIARLARWGLLDSPPTQSMDQLDRLADPYADAGSLEARARAYLHVNCSACHVEAGGGNAAMELEFNRPLPQMRLLDARPQHDSFGIRNAMLVAPGDPDRSILVHRLGRRGPGQMPPLVSQEIDGRALELMRSWIASLKPTRTFVREWTVEDLLAEVQSLPGGRSASAGKVLFESVGCAQCHRMGGAGGAAGPDLTEVRSRLDRRSVLESIVSPSAQIAAGFATHELELTDGEVVTGRIESEDDQAVLVRAASAVDEPIRVTKSSIRRRGVSAVSNMPAGMLNVLTREEVLDLLAYVLAQER